MKKMSKFAWRLHNCEKNTKKEKNWRNRKKGKKKQIRFVYILHKSKGNSPFLKYQMRNDQKKPVHTSKKIQYNIYKTII